MKKYIPFLFLILLLNSCSDSGNKEVIKENGYKIRVRVSYYDFLMTQNNYSLSPELEMVILKCEGENILSGTDFLKLLEETILADTTGINLFSLVGGFENRSEYMNLGSKEFFAKLNSEFEMSVKRCMAITEARLNKLEDSYPEIKQIDKNIFEVIVYNVKDDRRLEQFILSSARGGFYETADMQEIIEYFSKVSPLLYERDSLHGISESGSHIQKQGTGYFPKYFQPNFSTDQRGQYTYTPGALVGYAKTEDTPSVNLFLNDTLLRKHFPGVYHFLWGWKEENGLCQLYTIKAGKIYRPAISFDKITEAFVKNENGENLVIIHFNMDGSEEFKKLTAKNVNHSIAIVMDEKVISSPLVHSEITGGEAQVTGHFTKQEAEDLAAVLKAGFLPVRLEIISMEKMK